VILNFLIFQTRLVLTLPPPETSFHIASVTCMVWRT